MSEERKKNTLGRKESHFLVAMDVEGARSVVFGHLFGQPAGKNIVNTILAALVTDTEANAAVKEPPAAAQPPGT